METNSQASFKPFDSAQLGPLTLRNRFIKAATFEGLASENVVNEELITFHRRMAQGGVGMTTIAYCAVAPDGQGAPNEIIVRPSAAAGLGRFVDAIHEEGAAASIQLGHAGPVAAGAGQKGLSPSKVFSPQALRFTRAASEADLERIIQDFASAAKIVVDSGFDAIELHFGHGYLISSFLSPSLNRRKDRWGGSLENRARLARETARAVRDAIGNETALIAKFNMADGAKGGFWLDESVAVAELLESDGHLDALELTAGSSFQNPMYIFRGEAPIHEMASAFPQPLRTGFKLGAGRFLRDYPFQPAFLLPYARQFRSALKMPLILLGGLGQIATVESALAEGFEFVSLGRALLREPNLINRWQQGNRGEALCIHCNKCIPTIYQGTHCVLDPSSIR
ncbi:MAG: NADH:flavin oxidoreductase [Myxococcota bacterium]|nr:NADH:flavin oxidoreductase [Myxococcota bacterium]